ncbi:tRNA pseudouridine(38-40) synthase TruA [Desulfogranum japonicum]|uniref:tRNA pseudouridine(38-40) synthase TruA n=1 Tax=Desulfogranum japonicum TaxID=231447 RepID=UPI0003F6BFB1|nr:tRNA pseudouridine(38-40) synthase TruA [Desulfogranum japonicum]
MKRNIRLVIAFDGTGYCGWQRQENGLAVQEAIETGLSTMCKHAVTLHASGRTDAGVHALGMVAHFFTESKIPEHAFVTGLNSLLPFDIRIRQAHEVSLDFHSRFHATGKTYCYNFFTGDVQLPCSRYYTAHMPGDFKPERLTLAINALQGTHDFSSFEKAGSRDTSLANGRGAVRTLFEVTCTADPGNVNHYSLRFTGDGFLRQMVRILSGTLIDIGTTRLPENSMQHILASRDRRKAGLTAPANGLTLEKVFYSPLT